MANWIDKAVERERQRHADGQRAASKRASETRIYEARANDFWRGLCGRLREAVDQYSSGLEAVGIGRTTIVVSPTTLEAAKPNGYKLSAKFDEAGRRVSCAYAAGSASFERIYDIEVAENNGLVLARDLDDEERLHISRDRTTFQNGEIVAELLLPFFDEQH